jgi:hypothetical protein
MRQVKSVFSILKLDVAMNPPVFNKSLLWAIQRGLIPKANPKGHAMIFKTRVKARLPKHSMISYEITSQK